jgi:molybdate transport system substrate-binding protein
MADRFEKNHKDVKVFFNFAGSGQLRTQIENGAPVDVFVPASLTDMDALIDKGMIIKESKKILATNTLVLIVKSENKMGIKSPTDLANPEIKRIATGNPDTVPAGKYAKESMEYYKVSTAVKNKLVFGENVRQVLDYVSRNEVDAGFVFLTDTKIDKKFSKPKRL